MYQKECGSDPTGNFILIDYMENSKKCSKCGDVKSLGEFYKHNSRKDGLSSYCRGCCKAKSKAWSEENPDKKKALDKTRYEANSEKIKFQSRVWREANPYRVVTQNKVWREANQDKKKSLAKMWYEANSDKVKTQARFWRKANPEKMKAFRHKRRALKINAIHPDHDAENEKLKHFLAIALSQLFKEPYHVDHILPLSKGGFHHHENLQVIPGKINHEKKDSLDYRSDNPRFKHWSELPEFLLVNLKRD